ncbi:MAG: Gfo/Idh/MocA family oxidoreductase [Candidatus Krumholzibacteriota bacterium]|nr:Gfo/Idh/MocA family oxidoreductase [Candidatus Krumholzibacteriota bacterium]
MDGATRNLRAGVIGVGSLGMNHARNYSAIDGVELVCLHDIDRGRAEEAAKRFGGLVCSSIDDLLGHVDAVSVCTPATDHVEAVTAAMERGVHVLVEKPIASSAAEGKKLVRLAAERGVCFQVGHIERFNGAYEAAARLLDRPRFIESHRLGTFTPRGTDVSVVVDLMIHDIDLVLDVLGGEKLVDLRASGAGVLTDSPDIVNARLEFAGGCVANLTASRISREPLRKIRFFQENRYVSADLRAKTVEAFERTPGVDPAVVSADPTCFIRPVSVEIDGDEPLRKEIASFLSAVADGHEPRVTGMQGLAALGVAERILECL